MRRILLPLLLIVNLFGNAQTIPFGKGVVIAYSTGSSTPSPLAIPSISSAPISQSAIDVTVGNVSGAVSYNLDFGLTASGPWTALAQVSGIYHHTGLAAGTTYYYRARAIGNGSTNSNSAYSASNATTSNPTQLTQPSVSTTVLSTTAVDITVGTVASAFSYDLDYSTTSSGPWTNLTHSAGVFHQTGLTSSTTYYYRTRAVGNGTNTLTSTYNTTSATTNTATTQLSSPSISASSISASAIDVNIGSVANASSYVLEWSATGSAPWTQLSTSFGLYHHTGLTSSTTYFYRARAIGNGTTFLTSTNSTASATTNAATSVLTAPTLSVTVVSSTALDPTVGTVSGASSYSLEVSANGTTGWTVLSINAGVYHYVGLTPSTTYFFRAKAVGNGTTTTTSTYTTANATTNPSGGYSAQTVAWMNSSGISNDGTVYHAGSDLQVTGADYWNSADLMFQGTGYRLTPTIRAKLDGVYVAAGETEQSNSVNIINPGTYTLTHPFGYLYNGYGHKRANSSQVAVVSNYNVLQKTGNAYQYYIAGYTAATDFIAKAYVDEDHSLRLEDLGSTIYADVPSTPNRIILGNDPSGRVNWIQSTLNGSQVNLQREGETLGSRTISATDRMPDAQFNVFSNGVWSAFVIGRVALTQAESDTVRFAIEGYLSRLNKTITPQPEWGAPSQLVVDNTLKLATFQRNEESVALTDYEFTLDGGTTWTQFNDSNARINRTTEFGWGGVNDHTMSFYIGNQNKSAASIQARVKSRNSRNASLPVVANANITFTAGYDRYMPGELTYVDDPASRYNKFVKFTPALGAFVLETAYQVTFDSGVTWKALKTMVPYTENLGISPGKFGIRTVSHKSGHFDGVTGEWIPDQILSAPRWNTVPFTHTNLTTVNITGLKAFDATVKASTIAGNPVITLNNSNYSFAVGDRIIVRTDGTAFPNNGDRGTPGYVEWPTLHFERWTQMDSAITQNPSAYIPGEYASIRTDNKNGGQYNGYTFRVDGNHQFGLFWPGDPGKDKSYAGNFCDVITAVNGNQITVAHAPTVTSSNNSVYYDNVTKINQQLANVNSFSRVIFPAGTWHGSDRIFIPNTKNNMWYDMQGVTFASIRNERPVGIWSQGGFGIHFNDAGGDSVKLIGNFTYNEWGVNIARNGETYTTDLMPVRDEFFTGNAFGFDQGYFENRSSRVKNIAVVNAHPPALHQLVTDQVIDGWNVRYTELLPNSYEQYSSAPAYPPGYYWAVYNEGVGNTFKNGNFYSPKWINSIENFRATDNQFINVNIRNGHASFNTSMGCSFINVHFNLDSNIRYTQGSGTPVVDMNDNFGDNSNELRKNELNNVTIDIPKSIMNQAGVFPRGYQFGGTGPGIKMKDGTYNRRDIDEVYPGWYCQAMLAKGEGLEIDGFTVTGKFGAGVAQNLLAIEKPSAISITSLDGVPRDCQIKNVTTPFLYAPSGVTYQNITTTQLPFYPYPTITFAANPITEAGDSIHIQAITTGTSTSPVDASTINWQPWVVPERGDCNESDPDCWANNKVLWARRNTFAPAVYGLQKDGYYQFRFEVANTAGVHNFAYVGAYHAHQPPPVASGSFIDRVVQSAASSARLLMVLPFGSQEHDMQRVGNRWYWTTDKKWTTDLRFTDVVESDPIKGIGNLANSDAYELADNTNGASTQSWGFPYGQSRFPTWQYDSSHYFHLWGDMDNLSAVHMKDTNFVHLFQHPVISDVLRNVTEPYTHYDWNVRKNLTGAGYSAYYVRDGTIKIRWSENVNSDLSTWAGVLPEGKHIWSNGGLSIHNILEDADPCQFFNPFDGKWYIFCGMWDGRVQRLGIAEIYPPNYVGNYADGTPMRGTAKTPPYVFREPAQPWEMTYDLPRIFNPIPVWLDATHIVIIYSKNSDASGTSPNGPINYGPQGTGIIGPIQMNYILPLLMFGFKRNRRLQKKKKTNKRCLN